MQQIIQISPEIPLNIKVKRDDKELAMILTPKKKVSTDFR